MKLLPLTSALTLGLAAVFWMPGESSAQAPSATTPAAKAKPSSEDTYLQGYLTMLEGDKKAKSQDFVAAFEKYRDARDVFDSVHAGDPSWNVEIIDFRRRKIRESMAEMRKREMERRAAGGEPSPHGALGDDSAKPAPAADIDKAFPEVEQPRQPRNPSVLLEERVKSLYAQIARLEKRNEQILKENGAREAELFRMGKERLTSQATEKALRQRLQETRDKLETAGAGEKRRHQDLLKKVEELQMALNEANNKLASANASLAEMRTLVATLQDEKRQLIAERENLTKEKEQLLALMGSGDGTKSLEKAKIVAENQRLKKELAEAKEKMEFLSTGQKADRAQIAELKEQVRTVQDALAAVQQENTEYRQQIAALTKKLEAADQMLAESGSSGQIPESEAIAENSVLREIILAQFKQQARRERAHQAIMDELSKEGVFDRLKELGVESENVLRAVNEMAAPSPITREQRDILASTQVSKLLTDTEGSMVIVSNGNDTSAPEGPEDPPSPLPTGAEDKAGLNTELKAYANAAEEHFSSGDFTSAETNFRKILLVEPGNVYALCNLGVTQLRMGHNEEASETLMKALAHNYDIEFPHYARGVALLRLGRFDDAAEELEDALRINENNAGAWHTLGLIARKRGQRDVAKERFLKAVQMDSSCAEAHFNLAVIFATSEPVQMDEARRHYKLALSSGTGRDAGLDKLLDMR